jgi:hypothetical protein
MDDDLAAAGTPPVVRERRTKPLLTRGVARRLWSSPRPDTLGDAIEFQQRAYARAALIVRAFYAVSLLWVIQATASWERYASLKEAHPLWPAGWWFQAVSVRTGVNMIFGAYLVATLFALALPQLRLARIAYAFTLLQYMAFINGFDKINHDFHAWLFVSLVLILLPKGPWVSSRRTADRQYFLVVFATAQFVMLLFYTLTGFWKVYGATTDFAAGRIGGFNFSGFSYIVANRLVQTSQVAVLGDFFVKHEVYGWALFVGTMYLESFSVIITFRPRLQRVWGFGLILFHVGTQLAMGFTFAGNIVLLGLFFICSPFAPERVDIRATLLDLPVVHVLAHGVAWFRRAGPVRDRPPDTLEPGPAPV